MLRSTVVCHICHRILHSVSHVFQADSLTLPPGRFCMLFGCLLIFFQIIVFTCGNCHSEVFLIEFFEKLILKKISRRQKKKHENLLRRQRVKRIY